MTDSLMAIIIWAGAILVGIVGLAFIITRFYHKVEQGWAMIVNTTKNIPDVTFTGRIVWPIIHKREMMDISLKTINIDRSGSDGLICQDNIRADIRVDFYIKVNKTVEDVLKVAQSIGCRRASEQSTIEELFAAKFSEALKTAGKQMDFVELYQSRDKFRDAIIRSIGTDLNGYTLEDAAIDYLEQTPLHQLDGKNILDAQGIRKITELTAHEHIATNDFEQREKTEITKRNVEANEHIYTLEFADAEAKAKQQREIATAQAREAAETRKVEEEQRKISEAARLETDREISIQEETNQRDIEVEAEKRRKAVETETIEVDKAKELKIVDKNASVEVAEIEKEKRIEKQKKEIADIERERVAVEKTVAVEEEHIKTLRVVEESKRLKDAQVIAAQANAEEELVKKTTHAKAEEAASKHEAVRIVNLADARLAEANKRAESDKVIADGERAKYAAHGLAEAEVEKAKAESKKVDGEATAEVIRMQGEADAIAIEKKGLAEVAVKEADSAGEEKQAMVPILVKTKEAEAVIAHGEAEAYALSKRYEAEAEGIEKKAAAMATMDNHVMSHEEFRMTLEASHAENVKAIDANKDIAGEQAEVLAKALQDANIEVIGGEGDYFEKLASGLSIGKAVDGAVGKSDLMKLLAGRALSLGSGKSIPMDKIVSILSKVSGSLKDGKINIAGMSVDTDTVAGYLKQLQEKGSIEIAGQVYDTEQVIAMLESVDNES